MLLGSSVGFGLKLIFSIRWERQVGAIVGLMSVKGVSNGGRGSLAAIGARTSITSASWDFSTTGLTGSGGFSLQ